MKKEYRLKNFSEIIKVKQSGNSVSSPYLVLLFLPNHNEKTLIAVIASRSVGNAVKRNRCKRLLRAVIQPYLNEISTGYNIVLIARKRLSESKFEDVSNSTKTLLVKAGLLKEPKNE